jgi:hypothetical protein
MTIENFDDRFMFEQLQTSLALLEEKSGNTAAAIARWQQAILAAPSTADMQQHIDDLKQKLAAQPSPVPSK